MSEINKTQLDIERAEDRGIIHRDYAAHYFRWSFVLKYLKYQQSILDLGCANGMLAQVLYVNKFKPSLYIGIDIRFNVLKDLESRKVNFPVKTHCIDLRHNSIPYDDKTFDRITCFEMVEHFMPGHLPRVLAEAKRVLKDDGVMLLSTPNFNGQKAANHVHEYTETELGYELVKHFRVKNQFGTFASKSDVYWKLDEHEQNVYDRLREYYDSNVMSNIFAPLHPHESRNILWILQK